MAHVLKCWISFALALCISGALLPSARCATMYVEMYPFTGEVRLTNATATPFSLTFYSISSASSSLNGSPAVWKSISDVYDVSGNGFIDPTNNWTKFASTSSQLAEGVFSNPGGTLSPFRAISLGKVWTAPAMPSIFNLTYQFLETNNQFATVIKRLAIDGDYNQDGMVTVADYNLWKLSFGQSGTIGSLRADGNLNGIVDAADYTVWRNNLGLSLPGLGAGSSSGGESASFVHAASAVPEPAAAMLMLIAAGLFLLIRRSH
jgi:hypothetical protein